MKHLVTIAVMLIVGACGGGGGGEEEFGSPKAVADKLGCTNYSPFAGKVGADLSSDCEFAGDDITIAWFRSDESLDAYKKVLAQARQVGGSSPVVIGSNWSVECATSRTACEKVVATIGGELQE